VAGARRSITFVGFMAAGKSRIGRSVAERLGCPFIDTDEAVEASAGMTIASIFAKLGEAEFRRAERDAITQLVEGEAKVIAAGGGAVVDPDNRALLKARTLTIWLDPPFEVLRSRIRRSNARPMASQRSDEELRQLWEERRPSYADAHLRIVTSDEDHRHVVDRIVEQIG